MHHHTPQPALRRILSAALATALAAGWLLVVAPAALAACHIAGFTSSGETVAEADGTVSVTVELQGRQPSCEGTVDYTTSDGTAVAGEDYTATSGTLTFVAEDDREETFVVPILADDDAEDEEAFTITLANPTGSISGTGSDLVITIAADAAGADTTTTEDAEPSEAVEASPEASTAAEPAADDSDDGGNTLLIVLAIAAVLVIAGVVFVQGRRT
jgi:hypothetical protein